MDASQANPPPARAGSVRKAMRFVRIYGVGRTLFKIAGRLRLPVRLPFLPARRAEIGIIGCGQFAFATIAYFLRTRGRPILACFDTDGRAAASFARAHQVKRICGSAEELLATEGLRVVYIASNHASHTRYAVAAIERGLTTYVEKPIAVSSEQLAQLVRAVAGARSPVYVGYNRPFSAAVRKLRRTIAIDSNSPITLVCSVAGHVIPPNHWYRLPAEGTRICGNVGHWLDLFVHMLAWRGLPDRLEIALSWSNPAERDDNFSLSITSDRSDLLTFTMSSRSEPFEGIRELIQFHHGDAIAEIDDFRGLTVWQGSRLRRFRFWPKDVGHGAAIAQPFDDHQRRDWNEIVASTQLMIHIADMVRAGTSHSSYSLARARSDYESLAGSVA